MEAVITKAEKRARYNLIFMEVVSNKVEWAYNQWNCSFKPADPESLMQIRIYCRPTQAIAFGLTHN